MNETSNHLVQPYHFLIPPTSLVSLHMIMLQSIFCVYYVCLEIMVSVCTRLSFLLLTDNHLEALWVVLDEGLSLHRLGEESFGDQWKANAPQNLHDVLLSVTHIVLQPAHCCIINLNTNATAKMQEHGG